MDYGCASVFILELFTMVENYEFSEDLSMSDMMIIYDLYYRSLYGFVYS